MTNKELRKRFDRIKVELEEMKKIIVGRTIKPKEGQKYWFISGAGEIYDNEWLDHNMDHDCYAIGNCFTTEQSAEDAVRVRKLLQKAKESRNGFVPDWEDSDCLTEDMYYVCLDNGTICAASRLSWNQAPLFGFWEDKSECERFIHENNYELHWFFTEYQG